MGSRRRAAQGRTLAARRGSGVSQSEIVEAALKEFLRPDDYKTVSLEYLAKLERRHAVVLKRLELLTETLGRFIQVWFMSQPDIDDEATKRAIARHGKSRFDAFLNRLAQSLADETTFRRAFEERRPKPEDFFGGDVDSTLRND